MKSVFADADYWIALLNPHDQLHDKARSVSSRYSGYRVFTSEMVLVEVLAAFAAKGPTLRQTALRLAENLRDNPNTNLVPQTSVQFQAALELYKERQDKDWSLTDCASMLIMRQEGIRESLSYDKHFVQAGLIPLLREDSQQ